MSSYQPSVLDALPMNKTVVFYSPVEGNDVLVRTGTVESDSSFIHALLHAYSDDYVRSDRKDRQRLVDKLYTSLTTKLEQKRWENLSTSLIAQVPFQENITMMLTDFYKTVLKNKEPKISKSVYKVLIEREEKERSAYQIICELIPFERAQSILADCFTKFGDEKIDTCKQIVINKFRELALQEFGKLSELDAKLRNNCIERFVKLGEKIAEEADIEAYKNYVSNIKSKNLIIDAHTVSLFSDRLNRDIYLFDSRSHLPYRLSDSTMPKNRKAILVMWIGGNQYEVIGKLLQQNRIQREFYSDDPLIKRICTFVYHPENIADQYPNLIPYLPKDERDKIGFFDRSVSKSEKDESDKDESDKESSKEEEESDKESEEKEEKKRRKHSRRYRRSKHKMKK